MDKFPEMYFRNEEQETSVAIIIIMHERDKA